MEFKAARIKVQLQEGEHAAHLALKIGHQFLVLHTQYAARQNLVPVMHQPDVQLVVVPDILEAVGEFLTFGEQLLEVAEAASHRLAARIDDLSPRQDQVNQAEVP